MKFKGVIIRGKVEYEFGEWRFTTCENGDFYIVNDSGRQRLPNRLEDVMRRLGINELYVYDAKAPVPSETFIRVSGKTKRLQSPRERIFYPNKVELAQHAARDFELRNYVDVKVEQITRFHDQVELLDNA